MLSMPTIVEREPQGYVAVRHKVTIPFGLAVGPAFEELFAAFAQAGASPNGIKFIKYNLIDMPHLEIEVGITTDAALALTGRLVEGELPGGHYVSMTSRALVPT